MKQLEIQHIEEYGVPLGMESALTTSPTALSSSCGENLGGGLPSNIGRVLRGVESHTKLQLMP